MAAPQLWADLHADLVNEIVLRLPCAIDRAHMAAACRAWRAVVAPAAPPPPPLPSLLLSPAEATGVYCYLSGRRDHNNLPGPRHFGSCDGAWLFLAYGQTHRHRLTNIRTGESYPVPDLLRDHGDGQFHSMFVHAATISLPPGHLNCIAAGIVTYPRGCAAPRRRRFALWCLGCHMASCYAYPNPAVESGWEQEDVVYHGDSFYFLTQGEHILECRPNFGMPWIVTGVDLDLILFQNGGGLCDEKFVRGRYLVESRGELLMVVRLAPHPHAPTSSFKVFRMIPIPPQTPDDNQNEADKCHRAWEELDALDGRMLFLGRGCSRSYDVGQYRGFSEGIFFLDDRSFYDDDMMFGGVVRPYPCSDIGKWSEGPPPHVDLYFPERVPSYNSPPAWLLP